MPPAGGEQAWISFIVAAAPQGLANPHRGDSHHELPREAGVTLSPLPASGISEQDLTDRAGAGSHRALKRTESSTSGFCDGSSEPIGLRRLDARPIATLSIEAQERHERMEKVHRDD